MCVRKRLDKPFSVSIVPKRYINTLKNPYIAIKRTGDGNLNYEQFSGTYDKINALSGNGYPNLVVEDSLKVAKKKYWTDNFEAEYHGFRYATCYSKGVYSMGYRPLSLFTHFNGQEINLPREGSSHVINSTSWVTGVNSDIKKYYTRYFNDYCGMIAGKLS